MLFNSIEFVIFIAVVLLADFFVKRICDTRTRTVFLLGASLYFYFRSGWVEFVLLNVVMLVNGVGVMLFLKSSRRAVILKLLIVLNLLILFSFKYIGLAWSLLPESVRLGFDAETVSPLLPVGISFYIFQLISLLVDVQGDGNFYASVKMRKFFLAEFLMYISFFPQLVAGPIVKAKDFFWQIEKSRLDKVNWLLSVRFIIVGYFLKTVVADNLKDVTVYLSDANSFSGLSALDSIILLFGYSIQIFADFAGYSTIAIGLGLLLGFRFPINFNLPYIATSYSEFWTRWHVSLSTWLKEYLYFPLGGSRKGNICTYRNLFVVMLLGGLWHGAGWNYLIWGVGHGALLVIERFFSMRPMQETSFLHLIIRSVKRIYVFSGVTLLWLFFIYSDLNDISQFFSKVAEFDLEYSKPLAFSTMLFSLPVVLWHFKDLIFSRKELHYYKNGLVNTKSNVNLNSTIILGVLLALIILNHGTSGEFIYFQF